MTKEEKIYCEIGKIACSFIFGIAMAGIFLLGLI